MTDDEIFKRLDDLITRLAVDHEARIRVLERKNNLATAIVSGVVSVVTVIAASFLGSCV